MNLGVRSENSKKVSSEIQQSSNFLSFSHHKNSLKEVKPSNLLQSYLAACFELCHQIKKGDYGRNKKPKALSKVIHVIVKVYKSKNVF
jgi:hypothetical protein